MCEWYDPLTCSRAAYYSWGPVPNHITNVSLALKPMGYTVYNNHLKKNISIIYRRYSMHLIKVSENQPILPSWILIWSVGNI